MVELQRNVTNSHACVKTNMCSLSALLRSQKHVVKSKSKLFLRTQTFHCVRQAHEYVHSGRTHKTGADDKIKIDSTKMWSSLFVL